MGKIQISKIRASDDVPIYSTRIKVPIGLDDDCCYILNVPKASGCTMLCVQSVQHAVPTLLKLYNVPMIDKLYGTQ